MFSIDKKIRSCSGHCLFGRLVTVSCMSWSWFWYSFSRTKSWYTSVTNANVLCLHIYIYLNPYIYICICTYILHYIALHYVLIQYNDSTSTVRFQYSTLHYIMLYCTHTCQPKSIKLQGQKSW